MLVVYWEYVKSSSSILTVAGNYVERYSKVVSGSDMGSRVGVEFSFGLSATKVFSSASLVCYSTGGGKARILGEVSISISLVDSYLVRAIVLVLTIFQGSQDGVFRIFKLFGVKE